MIDRRRFLGSLGALGATAGGLVLPLFHSLREAKGSPEPWPRRLVIVYTPNGTIPSMWPPRGSEHSFDLGPILAPLAAHQRDLLVLHGVAMESCLSDVGDGHARGTGHLLTAVDLIPGPNNGIGGGISVDQVIARHVSGGTPHASLELGVGVAQGGVGSHISYRGAARPLPVENDPARVFSRLFGAGAGHEAALRDRRERRKSVLAAIDRELSGLKSRLSGADREKLAAHLEAVHELEERARAQGKSSCIVPHPPERLAVAEANVPAHARMQIDLLVTALACDLTRVSTLMLGNAVSHLSYRWLGLSQEHHEITHLPGEVDGKGSGALAKILHWHAEQFAYLLQRMKEVREGDGTMLDHSVVLWANELSRGDVHAHDDIPFVLAGRAGGLRPGRYLRYPNEPGKSHGPPHDRLLVSLCHAMGMGDVQTFGKACGRGPLPGLT